MKNICDASVLLIFLKKLNTNKSAGSDCILPVLLKESADVIIEPLWFMFSCSFERGVFPKAWKFADICPVPKSKPISVDNLRPISLLPVVSKLFEKIVL